MTTASLGTKLGIRKITARIGAEVTGVDPARELDPETVTAIRAALNEHKALVFRGVSLDDDGQQRFAGSFGPLTSAHPTVPAVDGEPNVLPVDSEDGSVNYWHTDVTFVLNPPQASTLRSIIVPPYGGETLIANTGAAYRYDDAPRRLNRVTVAGDVPAGLDGRQSYSVKGDASHYTPVAAVRAA
jgi:alpha-ketoglutarate-dependent sulfate ester dioxygenase